MNESNSVDIARVKVNLETSQIAWNELQRFFASGSAVFVASSLDLINVVYQFSIDKKRPSYPMDAKQPNLPRIRSTSTYVARSRHYCLGGRG